MPETSSFVAAGNAIRAGSTMTESMFVQAGAALETSIAILTRQTEGFDTLLTELTSEDLSRALKALGIAAARVTELGHTQSSENASFNRLEILAGTIAGRILHMNGAVKTVSSLSVSSKIAAGDIRSSAIDFSTFADEVAAALGMIQLSLDRFAAELLPIREYLAAARATQLEFEKRQDEAVRSISPRLLATVNAIDKRHRRAIRTTATVRQRSTDIRKAISDTVTALQVGDITRQRLEHVDHALTYVGETSMPNETTGLGADEQDKFNVALCCLQSAQLLDTAGAFDQEVGRIVTSLNSLATEARAFRKLGSTTYGADNGHGTFIGELEERVAEALQLLADFGTAQAESALVVASVSTATERLAGHLMTVRSLEADIRIMSLNTTLKCSRVGHEGLALGLIAQELRSYANTFARQAHALMIDMEAITAIAATLRRDREASNTPVVAAVIQGVQEALATLRQVGHILGDSLTDLERDSDSVTDLCVKTAANLANHNEIGQSLRLAADGLSVTSGLHIEVSALLTPAIERMLDLIARNYTMANERNLHDRVLGRSPDASAAQVATGEAAMEDVLF